MKWKLIFGLSLFGLAMAIATVFVIPSNIEPLFWLVIFAICAVIIARTAAHIAFFRTYIANHAKEAAMMQNSVRSVVRTPSDSLQKSKNLEKWQNSPLSPFREAEILMTKASFCSRVCE